MPQLPLARLRLRHPQVLRDRAGEQERRLRHQSDVGPQPLGGLLAHVHAVDGDGAASRLTEPQDQMEQRGLAAAGAAHHRGGAPRPDRERQARQYRALAAGVAEGGIAELHDPGHRLRDGWPARVRGTRARLDDLGDPFGARHRPGQQDHHGDRDPQIQQNLQDVDLNCRQITERHPAIADQASPEPSQAHARQVDQAEHRRQHHREDPVGPQRGTGHVVVHLTVARGRVPGTQESTDHPRPGHLLPHHPVEPVDLELHRPEQRHDQQQHHRHDHRHDHQRHQHQQRQARPVAHRHHQRAAASDNRQQQQVEHHLQEQLHLLHVIDVASHQGRDTEPAQLLLGQCQHPPIDRLPHGGADRHRDPRGQADRQQRHQAERQRDPEHHPARPPDISAVPHQHTVVDDVGVEAREVEVPGGLDRHQRHDHGQSARMRPQETTQQPDHGHSEPSPFPQAAVPRPAHGTRSYGGAGEPAPAFNCRPDHAPGTTRTRPPGHAAAIRG